LKWARSIDVASINLHKLIKVKNPEPALSFLPISKLLSKQWPIMLQLKNQEKPPESPKASIPTHPERNPTTNVNTFLTSVPPKNEKEAVEKKKGEKANEIQNMDEHKIPLEELLYRFGANLETGLTTEMAIKRNLEEGDNRLPEK
jgi:hypothetical protein